jgi:hypothetical protein
VFDSSTRRGRGAGNNGSSPIGKGNGASSSTSSQASGKIFRFTTSTASEISSPKKART